MAVHKPDVSAAEAREALSAITQVIARGYGLTHGQQLRVLDQFVALHETTTSPAKRNRKADKDGADQAVPAELS